MSASPPITTDSQSATHWTSDLVSATEAVTLHGLFRMRVERSPEYPAYRYHDRERRQWLTLSWSEMAAHVAQWRRALLAEGLQPGERVAIQLRNCPEWVMFDQAALALGLVSVPLYTDDRPENAAYILRDAGVRLLLIQDAGRWTRLAPVLEADSDLRRVVILEEPGAPHTAVREDSRVRCAQEWLVESCRADVDESVPEPADPDALATIVYTSGTTGRPKGVMLSHRNILCNVDAVLQLIAVYREDLFLSFLPLSHALERTGGYYLPMMAGAGVVYARSIGQLGEDLQNLHPTVVIAVPRVFERIYQRMLDQVQERPPLLRALFGWARTVGWRAFLAKQGRAGWTPALWFWPLLYQRVARRVLERFGGRIRVVVSGGAPLPAPVAHLFLSLGLNLLQGYGLTETSPVISVNPLRENIPESVGVPLPGLQLRIGDADELLVKGPSVMLGYWNSPEATARILEPDGWLHTGDQARIADGHLFLTGRVKDILVLSNGEKVSPTDIEMAIALDPLFEQVVVLGEGHAYLSALLVLNEELWPELAQTHGLSEDMRSLADVRLHKGVLQRIRTLLHDCPGYAKVRRVTLCDEPWTVDNGLLTPTLKVKRGVVIDRYRDEIREMYSLDTELA